MDVQSFDTVVAYFILREHGLEARPLNLMFEAGKCVSFLVKIPSYEKNLLKFMDISMGETRVG